MESHWKVGLLLKSRQLRKKRKTITTVCQLQGSFGRTGSQARRAALGHGRWRLWFSPTYEGNTSLSIPRNVRMTMQGMLRPDSNPGMEPKLYLLQPTTKYHSIISHEVSTLLAVQLYRRSVFCTLCKTFTLLAAPFASWQLKLCLIKRGQSIEQLKGKKTEDALWKKQHPNFPGKATTTTNYHRLPNNTSRLDRLGPWGQ